ncbi:MAG: 1-(5-phosphoribosyl)-5-amino-4-imidazole-carboxylate carboxylase, partial [Gammaproteobacteria bacterium]|nr:1-(5-phosphoribosyl)-5-amino-4-imidazole-carboxylate carboxylase [Gammaproteobacteria bacterium]
MALDDILAAFKDGAIETDEASRRIRAAFFQSVGQPSAGHSTLDSDRLARTGASEVIYGAGKSAAEVADLVEALVGAGQNALVTRTTPEAYEQVLERTSIARYHEAASAITATVEEPSGADTLIAVITAGTSDAPVAE